jgi:ABC-type Fe3+/spermidine/putrescine transport system ATPase subunit
LSIVLESFTKRHGEQLIVNNVSLEIKECEFFVFFGSQDSGKTSLLRLMAGLIKVDQGRLLLNGRDITHLPAAERNFGVVQQEVALFEHMTVAENVEFGLRVRSVHRDTRRRWRDELLDLVGLAGLGQRLPRQLSAIQQQRVALARAVAPQPALLLVDEPLYPYEAARRADLHATLETLHRELRLTTILATHDQEVALAMADRMGVMSFGRLLEVGTPTELYHHPRTEYVATTLGGANLLLGHASEDGVQIGPYFFDLDETPLPTLLDEARRVQALFRPEAVVLVDSAKKLGCTPLGRGEVESVTFRGFYEKLRVRVPPIPGVRPLAPPVAFGNRFFLVEAIRSQESAQQFPLQPGDPVWVGVKQIHAIAHPGLHFLVVTGTLSHEQATVAGLIGRLTRARTTLLSYGGQSSSATILPRQVEEAKEQINGSLPRIETHSSDKAPIDAVREELEHQPSDVVVLGLGANETLGLAAGVLALGHHHVLLVPQTQQPPQKALICVASGEPGRADVLFAGRFLRHLNAEATLLTVLPASAEWPEAAQRARHFLDDGGHTLQLLNVPANTLLRHGLARAEIGRVLAEGEYDLLVLGAPLPALDGTVQLSTGLVGELLRTNRNCAILIISSSGAWRVVRN